MIARSSLTLLLLCMLSACASSPVVNLHSLLPLSEPAAERDAGPRPRIVIASTVVPESVDRPQLLVALGGHEMRLLENERWSEPLKRAIPRALAHHLAQDIPAIVWSSSAAAPQNPDLRILLDVTRWQSVPGEGVAVEVLWTLRKDATHTSGRSRVSVPVAGERYADLVAGHREALRRVAGEIAHAARTVLLQATAGEAQTHRSQQ